MRVKYIEVSYDFMTNWFKKGEHHFRVIENALPNDAKVIDAFKSPFQQVRTLRLIITSKRFKDIPDTGMIPKHEPIVFQDIKGRILKDE